MQGPERGICAWLQSDRDRKPGPRFWHRHCVTEKAHHGSHTVPCAPQGLERFGQAKPERADHTRRRNCHAGWIIRPFRLSA